MGNKISSDIIIQQYVNNSITKDRFMEELYESLKLLETFDNTLDDKYNPLIPETMSTILVPEIFRKKLDLVLYNSSEVLHKLKSYNNPYYIKQVKSILTLGVPTKLYISDLVKDGKIIYSGTWYNLRYYGYGKLFFGKYYLYGCFIEGVLVGKFTIYNTDNEIIFIGNKLKSKIIQFMEDSVIKSILIEFELSRNKSIELLYKIYRQVADIDNYLILACKYNLNRTAEYIITNNKLKININLISGKNKESAIMYACKNNMPEVAKLLLLNGSRIKSESALISCMNNRMFSVIDLIILLKLYTNEMILEIKLLEECAIKEYVLSKLN